MALLYTSSMVPILAASVNGLFSSLPKIPSASLRLEQPGGLTGTKIAETGRAFVSPGLVI